MNHGRMFLLAAPLSDLHTGWTGGFASPSHGGFAFNQLEVKLHPTHM